MIKSIRNIKYSIGGYSQGESSFNLDGYEVSFWENLFACEVQPPQQWINRKVVSEDEKEKLIETLNKIKFLTWKKEYDDKEMLDGTQWTILVTYNGNLKKKVYGSNAYPKGFNKFETHLKQLLKHPRKC